MYCGYSIRIIKEINLFLSVSQKNEERWQSSPTVIIAVNHLPMEYTPLATFGHWSDLPSDVQQDMLLHLPIKDLLSCSATNKLMFENMNKNNLLWRTLYHERAGALDQLNASTGSNTSWKIRYQEMFAKVKLETIVGMKINIIEEKEYFNFKNNYVIRIISSHSLKFRLRIQPRLTFGAAPYARAFPFPSMRINAGTAKILRVVTLATRSTGTSKITCYLSTTLDWAPRPSSGRSTTESGATPCTGAPSVKLR